jgi:virginiamycin B lyase
MLTAAAALLGAAAGNEVVITEWDVPTPGSRPHDPAVAPDGALWYTGQRANTLGRLDPATGEIKEYLLKTPQSGPHGLVADKEGNIWYTGNARGHIGKLNPQTGEVTEYPMPDPAAGDPHTPVFDPKGHLWFTVQRGNFVGRLDPGTGKVMLKRVSTPNALPYGMVVSADGIPFFCAFGTNKLARIDPATMEITEYALPEGARSRRLDVTPAGMVYYTDFARGYLGRLNPADGKIEEWPSPGGPASEPYGIAVTPDGMVWYSESGVTPNTLVRFDPNTRSFAVWPIPSGGGVIRHMIATPRGDLYLACSGVNKVGIAKVTR